jgi:hypothetical protein
MEHGQALINHRMGSNRELIRFLSRTYEKYPGPI